MPVIRGRIAAVSDPDTETSVVLGVPGDFYARCADSRACRSIQDRPVLVGPMTAAELRRQ
jgi:hypothetical protein